MKTKLHLFIALILGLGISAQVVGPVTITGNGTGGWSQPGNLVLSSTDGGTVWTASNFEIVGDGQMKFSEGGTWATSSGHNGADVAPFGFPSGTAAGPNAGNNIHGTPGFWNVTYNVVTREYAFTAGVNPNPVINISGGGLTADVQMNSSNGTLYSKKSVFFSGGVASFKETSPTTAQWGGTFPDCTAAVAGGTITVTTGPFNVYFTMPSATGPAEYIFEPTVVSMIGNFVGSGWGTDLDLTTSDNIHYTMANWPAQLVANSTDTSIHLKFRDNHDWATQYGEGTGTNGGNSLALTGTSQNGINGGGGDIFIPFPVSGSGYDVVLNRSTGEWTFTSVVLGTSNFASAKFNVYPNPTTNNWNFVSNNNAQINTIQIVDMLGKVVLTKNVTSNEVTVDASNLNTGIYFARIATATAIETVKLVKN